MVKWMNDNPGNRLPLFEQRNVSVAGVGTYGVEQRLGTVVEAIHDLEGRFDEFSRNITRNTKVESRVKVDVRDKRRKLTLI